MDSIIKIESLSKRNPDFKRKSDRREWLLDNISLEFPANKVSLIIGENGCGKSTLLNCISGLTPFEKGLVTVSGPNIDYKISHNLTENKKIKNRHKLGIIFQQKALWETYNVFDNIFIPLSNIDPNIQRSKIWEDASELLGNLGVSDPNKLLNSFPNKISGGEQRKIAAARTILTDPDILLIDELEANLDLGALEDVLRFLKDDFLKLGSDTPNNKSLIIISHRIDLIELKFAPEIFLVSNTGDRVDHYKSFTELTNNSSNDIKVASFIKKVIDPAKSQWFYGTTCLKAASDISKLILTDAISKMSEGEMLQQIGKKLFELVCTIEPNDGHLLMIITLEENETKDSMSRIRSLELTPPEKQLILNGDNFGRLCKKIVKGVPDPVDSNSQIGLLENDYEKIILEQTCQLKEDNSAIEFAINNYKTIYFQNTKFHDSIYGCKKIQPKVKPNSKFIEICKSTNTIYTIVISNEDNVFGVISIDTTCKEVWSNTLMEQFKLVANMAAVAINYTKIKK